MGSRLQRVEFQFGSIFRTVRNMPKMNLDITSPPLSSEFQIPRPSTFINEPILLKFEMNIQLTNTSQNLFEFLKLGGTPSPLPSTLNYPKVKFFIYCAILMKFETHFNMFTNNN